jgi:hypothetical protein
VPGSSSQDLLAQTVDSFASRVQDYASGIANRLGSPLSGQQLSKDDVVARWNFSPLGSSEAADAQYHQLVAQGTPPGQALQQVYPMRQMLYQGADLKEAIANAQKIQGWSHEAAGTEPPPKFEGSTLPLSLAQQHLASMNAPPPPAMPAPPGPAVGPALPPLPQAPGVGGQPPPMAGPLPPGPPPPMPGPQPMPGPVI